MADTTQPASTRQSAQQGEGTSCSSAEIDSASRPQGGRTWSQYGWRVYQGLCHAWACFDRVAGWLLGLDTPKYEWAIYEHRRLLREEEDSIMNGSGVRQQAKQADALEGQTGECVVGPTQPPAQQVAMMGHAAKATTHSL